MLFRFTARCTLIWRGRMVAQVEPSADALLALVMADEAGFGQLVAHLVSRCPDETSAARLQEHFGVLMTAQGLSRSLSIQNRRVFRRNLAQFLATARGFLHAR